MGLCIVDYCYKYLFKFNIIYRGTNIAAIIDTYLTTYPPNEFLLLNLIYNSGDTFDIWN